MVLQPTLCRFFCGLLVRKKKKKPNNNNKTAKLNCSNKSRRTHEHMIRNKNIKKK